MSALMHLLALHSGLPPTDLMRIIQTAPRRYKVFQIPKRTGGSREIAQPAREVKLLQRILVEVLLESLPVHPNAVAYQKGIGLVANAQPHAGSTPILKMDFAEFFPKIRAENWIKYCADNELLTPEERVLSALLLFRRRKGESLLRLSIGAPSSPMLSNILMAPFDQRVAEEAKKRGISYTRYADDLTFSGQRIGFLKDIPEIVADAARKVPYPVLEVNKAKTKFITAAHRRTVTGVVLSNQGEIGLGRDRKRLISAKVHRALGGGLEMHELRRLAGDLAFANAVEPQFMDWLAGKYGAERLHQLKRLKVQEA